MSGPGIYALGSAVASLSNAVFNDYGRAPIYRAAGRIYQSAHRFGLPPSVANALVRTAVQSAERADGLRNRQYRDEPERMERLRIRANAERLRRECGE